MKTQTVETWLPVFTGFYNTIFELDTDNAEPVYFEDEDVVEYDIQAYQMDAAEKMCKYIQDRMDVIESIEFQSVCSPQFYNFSNDSINIKVTVDVEQVARIVQENSDSFADYLSERYTSRDGFISHYSDDITDWMIDTKGFTEFTDNTHKLGAILDWIATEIDEITTEDLYYSIEACAEMYMQEPDVSMYINKGFECYRKGLSREETEKEIQAMADEQDDYSLKVNKIVNEVFDEIESKTLNLFAQDDV